MTADKNFVNYLLQYADYFKQKGSTEQVNQILYYWNLLAEELAELKELENKMRELCANILFRNHDNDSSKTIELGSGYRLRGTFKTNYTLNKDPNAIDDVREKLGSFGISGKQAGQAVIYSEFKFSKTEYDKLPKEFRDIIDTLLVSSPGATQLKLLKPGEN
jgi:hypothetical protein